MILSHLLLFWISYVVSHVIASDLRPTSVSSVTQGTNHVYTMKYQSTKQATVVWSDAELIYNFTMATISETFSEGEGESSLMTQFPPTALSLRIFIRGESSVFFYTLQGIQGETILPETDIISPLGKTFEYTPGIPLTVNIQYTRESGDFTDASILWYFVGIDNDRIHPIIEVATAWDPNIERFISNVTETAFGPNYDVSTQIQLTSQTGMVAVVTSYRGDDVLVKIERLEVFYIRQSGQQGPFPHGFLDIFDPLVLSGNHEIACKHLVCTITCYGVGPNINRVELRKAGSETPMASSFENPSEWLFIAEYQLFPVSRGDGGSYTCSVFNDYRSVEKEIRVKVY